MFGNWSDKLYPSAKKLVRDCVASRIHAKDATLYEFDDDACACACNFMGWTDLATNPPTSPAEIQAFASEVINEGFKTVLLIGQGGSTQAPMTITKYNKVDCNALDFKTLDSLSPVRVRSIVSSLDPATTLVLVSSKSGTTIEMKCALSAVLAAFKKHGGVKPEDIPRHLVAITDAGTPLEKRAKEDGWRACFTGEASVGGRFSALSVFGLVPAALVGIDLESFLARAQQAELDCSIDDMDNPAIRLASFLCDNAANGRGTFCFLTQKRGRVLGLWIEQLIAESLGKEGRGILPNIEVDSLLLAQDRQDRCAVVYNTKNTLWDESKSFEVSLAYLDDAIPRIHQRIEDVIELAEHFVVWEYATAMCGYLMQVCPFDQPDVASTKAATLTILTDEQPKPRFVENFLGGVHVGEIEVTTAPCVEADTLTSALRTLFESIKPGDYFALNAFLPFDGEGRREALEAIRHGVADVMRVPACLEIGPRYLHSTGQLQKGGPNNGVFLIISSDEFKDIPLVNMEAASLGTLSKAEALADLSILIERGRRCMHLHLPDNAGVTLRALSDDVCHVLGAIQHDREGAQAG